MSFNPFSKNTLTVSQAILWGGIVAGVLDATDGVIAYGILGMNPIQVLQYIASGALGASAFSGGLATAALGALLHFMIAFVVATVFVLASRQISALAEQPVVFGLLFGAAVFIVMTYGVLPFSSVARSPFSLGLFLNGIIGHALFVGLPIALYASRVSQPGMAMSQKA
jgi:uncharacterized membrane protein YagU involved in acid resistance